MQQFARHNHSKLVMKIKLQRKERLKMVTAIATLAEVARVDNCVKYKHSHEEIVVDCKSCPYSNRKKLSFTAKQITETKSLPRFLVTVLLLSTCFALIIYNAFLAKVPNNLIVPGVDCQRQSKAFQQQPTVPILPQKTQQFLLTRLNQPDIVTNQGGLIKEKNVTLTKQFNPIIITKDIIIRKDAKLTIEAGAELLFDKRRGIIVHGTLEILGSSNDRIKLNLLKSQQSATVNFRSQNNNPIDHQQVRLVDGETPNEGRVQIKFNDNWHSLCTNSKNLTAADIRVLCQQVGFQDGSWYKWFPKRNESTFQILSKSFQCGGNEKAISQCKRWNRIRVGGGVCNHQSDLGIRCSKTLIFGTTSESPVYDYWRGIEFINSDTNFEYVLDGLMKRKISKSNLEFVTLSDAGVNEVGNATAAIRVFGQPPKMNNIDVKNSIYGIMIEDVDDAFELNHIRLVNNMANPLFVNTSWGKVVLDNLHVENNGGDGIRVARHEKVLVGTHDFCTFANLGSSQSFPIILSHEQTFFTLDRECCQEFTSDNQLTVHFPVLRSTPNNLLPERDSNRRITIPPGVNLGKDANLVIYDDYRDEFPFRLNVKNNTRAQSIVSKSGRLKICYEPATYRTVLFTIEVVAEAEDEWSGKHRDVEISNSIIRNNEGRGIWIENQRSGVRIINTTVTNHNYLSGMHFENGTGEVIIQGSKIVNNTGHGVFVNLAGGYFHIDNSTISDNTQRGISIEYDKRSELVPFNHTFQLGYSLIARNGENGLFVGNVCRSDAFWNISMNSFIKNGEDAIYFQSCLPTPDAISSFKSLTSRLNLSDPDMNFHNNYQEFHVTHNVFLANLRRALHMAPVFFVKSFIRHNLFKDHPLAVLYISNQDPLKSDFLTVNENSTLALVNIRIASNRFYSNQGRYVVNIGVQEDNPRHSLMFTKNFLEDNVISEPYPELRPRSRVSAVVVVSSSNSKVIRNRFDNPQSTYEFGSHLEMHSKVINATTNFWGRRLDATSIYKRIFDRKNRYNLAQVEFLQYLLSPEDLEYASDLSFDRERDKISTFKNGTRLGGEIKGFEELDVDTYLVQDDIFIRSGGYLVLKPGTVFKFLDGVGMMVQGRLDAIGTSSSNIILTSAVPAARIPQRAIATTTPAPVANSWVSHLPEENESEEENGLNSTSNRRISTSSVNFKTGKTLRKRQAVGYQNVRLSHTTMGRLEVQIDGLWGSVCDYNFDIRDAAVACQQLGMILNKDEWLLEKFQYAANDQQQISMVSNNVLMTNLRCDPSLDTDITKCKAEFSTRGDFDGLCDSEVGIRCFPPSWSGVRFGMGAEVSTLEHVTIQRAGMFDYAAYALRPALQVDFYRHWFSSLVVKSNSDSGMGIMWSDVIGRHFSELTISESKFLNNERHGVELRTKGLSFKNCSITNNRQSGLDYNPTLTQRELNDLLSWLRTAKNSENVITLNFPLQKDYFSVPSSEESYRFFVFAKNPLNDLKQQMFTISTDPGHMLSIHLLNPIHPDSTEQLNMTLGLNPDSPTWDFRFNMTSFPMVSPGYKFHFNYSTGDKAFGNMVIYVRSRYNNRDLKLLNRHLPQYLVLHKFEQTAININSKLLNSLVISHSNITKNGVGIKLKHSNYFFGPEASFNRRYANETFNITNNLFDGNQFSSIFVGSEEPFGTTHQQQLDLLNNKTQIPSSEIYYYLLGNKFRRNRDGIRQFTRDIRSSYNVFHWSINDTTFESNRGGGISITLPYFWRYDSNLSHTVEIHSNNFVKNTQFEMSLDGHFVDLNITNNIFKENKCKTSLMALKGMEKKMVIEYNVIEFNACNRLVEFNIQSHADKLGNIRARFEFNSLRYNRKLMANSSYTALTSNFKNQKLLGHLHPHATDYALSMRGIQIVNFTRNLLINPDLRFELVVAVTMDPKDNYINAVENYWGSVLLSEINDRIFDFDDWNSYAIAQVSPFLNQDSFSAATIAVDIRESYHLLGKPLGGRLTKSLTLTTRKEPYLVETDLTILEGVRLTVEKGVTLEFMPNVGILVLGELIAAGSRDKQIVMRPVLSAADLMPMSQYLYPSKAKPYINQWSLNDPLSYEHSYAFKHYQSAYPVDMGSLRLCKNEICNDGSHIYENNIEDQTLRQEVLKSSNNTWKMDGFLEIFNMTTLQWVPVCDPLFTEHNAKVVCRQLGYSHLSLFKRGRRYTIEQEQISSIKHWPDSVQCEGDESSMSSCHLAAIGSFNHSTECTRDSNQFLYIYCRDFPDTNHQHHHHKSTNENAHHWGGVRFSCPSIATTSNSPSDSSSNGRESYNMISNAPSRVKSRLQYVNIEKAGMLHRIKSPAVQILQCSIHLEFVVISNSAHHGLEMITSQGHQNFHQLRLRNNLGVGLNYLSLTGSSSASRLVPYLPLKHLDIGSELFGLVDICGANKEIQIEDRVLLFYRYNSQPVDCIKIVSSKFKIKHIGIRMLQFDLFNSTAYTTRPDSIKIYDGNIFDRDSRLLVDMGVTERHRIERPELKFYQTSDTSMTIRLHVSGASSLHGFIAEVVTTPLSYNIQRDTYNNITFSEITTNKLGAVSIYSAGESTPNFNIKNNRIESNCLHLFGNFTSCTSPVYMELQNCQLLKIINNLIKSNQGGVTIKSYSHSAVSALDASIENNVFESNQNAHTLALLGPKTDPYQSVRVLRNFFTRNVAPYSTTVVLSRIVANFSYNIMSSNTGKHQIEVMGFDRLPLSYQNFVGNWIYNNTATLERDRSTISGNSAGQQYRFNYLVNPDNHFEISTLNWSRYDVKPFHIPRDDEIIHLSSGDGSTKDMFRKTADKIPLDIIDTKKIDLYHATIKAEHNWWGFDTTPAIQGRIRDRAQREELLKVDFVPFLETNTTVLSGICAGGWQKVGEACLVYIGTRMTYQEAEEFCDRERATLPLLRGDHYEISDFIRNLDEDFDARIDRVWIRSFDVSHNACPALNDYRTKNYDCQEKYSFLCEKDPQIVLNLSHWHRETGGLIAIILFLITVLLSLCCTVCWGYKSRQRHKEKLERKNSIYASFRSNRAPYSSSNSLSELFLHRQIYNPEKSSITDLSMSTQLTQPSNDGSQLVHLDPAYGTAATKSRSEQASTYVNGRPRTYFDQQLPTNPAHLSPPPSMKALQKKSPSPMMNPEYTDPSTTLHNNLTNATLSPPSIDSDSLMSVSQQSQIVKPPPTSAYIAAASFKRSPSRNQLSRTPLPSMNPDYVRPSPREQVRNRSATPSLVPDYMNSMPSPQQSQLQYQRFPTPPPLETEVVSTPVPLQTASQYSGKPAIPAPSYREAHPRALNNGSRTPSYSGSYTSEVLTNPMPIPAPVYSQLDYMVASAPRVPILPPTYDTFLSATPNQKTSHQQTAQPPHSSSAQMRDIDESDSSAPTYYSNQIETYEESTQSYIEAYNNAYNKALQRLSNEDNSSYVITERSSITDLLFNSTKLTRTTSIKDASQVDLVDFKTQNNSDYYVNSAGAHSNKAFSETASNKSQQSRFLVETSFDLDEPPTEAKQTSMFGSSPRLSPVSSNYAIGDSKLGSRVYLETSFE